MGSQIYEHGAFRAVLNEPREDYRDGVNPHARVKKALEKIARTGKPPAWRSSGFGSDDREGATAADYLRAMGETLTGEDTVHWAVWSCGCQTRKREWRHEEEEGNLHASCPRHSHAFSGRCCICGEYEVTKDSLCWSCWQAECVAKKARG